MDMFVTHVAFTRLRRAGASDSTPCWTIRVLCSSAIWQVTRRIHQIKMRWCKRRHALLGNQRALQQRNLGGRSKRELHSPTCFAAATFRAVAHFAAGVLRVTPLARARGG